MRMRRPSSRPPLSRRAVAWEQASARDERELVVADLVEGDGLSLRQLRELRESSPTNWAHSRRASRAVHRARSWRRSRREHRDLAASGIRDCRGSGIIPAIKIVKITYTRPYFDLCLHAVAPVGRAFFVAPRRMEASRRVVRAGRHRRWCRAIASRHEIGTPSSTKSIEHRADGSVVGDALVHLHDASCVARAGLSGPTHVPAGPTTIGTRQERSQDDCA